MSRVENVIISHIMQSTSPKQNGFQKYVVRLDTKANERRGSCFPDFFALSSPIAACKSSAPMFSDSFGFFPRNGRCWPFRPLWPGLKLTAASFDLCARGNRRPPGGVLGLEVQILRLGPVSTRLNHAASPPFPADYYPQRSSCLVRRRRQEESFPTPTRSRARHATQESPSGGYCCPS